MAHHAFSASLGDLIAVAALAIAWLTFRLDRAASDRGEVLAATALLRGLKEGFFSSVGDNYFSGLYTATVAEERARSSAGRSTRSSSSRRSRLLLSSWINVLLRGG
jgi:hypothetical protein